MPLEDDASIRALLKNAKTIAVVGASEKSWRDSFRIFEFLKNAGYNVYPVNPHYNTIGNEQCYPTVTAIGRHIDIVDVFRNPDAVEEVVTDAVAAGASALWLQLGVVHQQAAARAEQQGLVVVMNRCIAIEYSRLMR